MVTLKKQINISIMKLNNFLKSLSKQKKKNVILEKKEKEAEIQRKSSPFEIRLVESEKTKEGIENNEKEGIEEENIEDSEKYASEEAFSEKHHKNHPRKKEYIQLGVPGFDTLLQKGIPKASSILVCGGAGTGKTIFGLQVAYAAAKRGEKAMYMSFEESEDRLRQHMHDFGWDSEKYEKKGLLIIKRYKPFDITKTIEALLMKAKGELIIDLKPVIFPHGFQPDILVIDSLSAISAAFVGREETYRVYIEQLFLLLEKTGTTSLLVTETEQIPSTFLTKTGIEEFLADGVILLYYVRLDHRREHSCEILKMRGSKHIQEIVPLEITDKGIRVWPNKKLAWQKRKSIYADKLPVYHS